MPNFNELTQEEKSKVFKTQLTGTNPTEEDFKQFRICCEILELDPQGFSQQELRTSFKNKGFILHPDKNLGNEKEATSNFQYLREANQQILKLIENEEIGGFFGYFSSQNSSNQGVSRNQARRAFIEPEVLVFPDLEALSKESLAKYVEKNVFDISKNRRHAIEFKLKVKELNISSREEAERILERSLSDMDYSAGRSKIINLGIEENWNKGCLNDFSEVFCRTGHEMLNTIKDWLQKSQQHQSANEGAAGTSPTNTYTASPLSAEGQKIKSSDFLNDFVQELSKKKQN